MKKAIFIACTVGLSVGCTTPKAFLTECNTEASFISKIGNQSSHTFRGFDLDKSFNIYISGTTFGTVEACSSKYQSGHAGLLMKLKPDLKCEWGKLFEAKKDRQTCFLREVIVDKDEFILLSGICHGELHIGGQKQFDAVGKFQSFIAKLDNTGKVIWLNRYFTDQNFIITNVIRTDNQTYTAIGIRDEDITVVFEVDNDGKYIQSKAKEYKDPAKIYNNILQRRGKKLFQSSIGEQFVTIRELDNDLAIAWEINQDTKASLMPVKAHIAMDIRKGLWLSIPFLTGNEQFEFGKDKLTGTGLFDTYLTQFKGRKQGHSIHIKGESDQIVTGLFDGNKNRLSLSVSHGNDFSMGTTAYNKGPGISLIEFNAEKPDKMVYSTFPIENKERDRITNTGVYFRHDKGKYNYLGGFFIKGEMQTTNPRMTVGKDVLEIVNPVFNSFVVKGTRKS